MTKDEMKFWKLISEYFDSDKDFDINAEIERFIYDDPDVRAFFNNFDKTLQLCNQIEADQLNVPDAIHVQLIQSLRVENTKKPKKRKVGKVR